MTMRASKWNVFGLGLVATLVVGSLYFGLDKASAQGMGRPTGSGDLYFQSNLGSFKLLGNDQEPEVTGTLTFSFTGTVLISGTTSEPTVTGNVIKEYDSTDMYKKELADPNLKADALLFMKRAYHGTGSISITGPLRAVEWFGSDMKGHFVGRGIMRITGEFDKNLNTGTYYFADNPSKVNYWPANNLMEIVVPAYQVMAGANAGPTPINRKDLSKGGG